MQVVSPDHNVAGMSSLTRFNLTAQKRFETDDICVVAAWPVGELCDGELKAPSSSHLFFIISSPSLLYSRRFSNGTRTLSTLRLAILTIRPPCARLRSRSDPAREGGCRWDGIAGEFLTFLRYACRRNDLTFIIAIPGDPSQLFLTSTRSQSPLYISFGRPRRHVFGNVMLQHALYPR